MKKLLPFICLMLLFSSGHLFCSKRNYEEMVAIAKEQMLQKTNNSSFSKTSRHTPFHSNIVLVDSSNAFYVFSADRGFVVVSSDDRFPPVLGYGLDDPYDPNNIPPALSYFLSNYDKKLRHLDSVSQLSRIQTQKETFLLDSVAPLIKTKWGQRYPYNAYSPLMHEYIPYYQVYVPCTPPTGCIATAMAQLMNYYQYPKQGKGSHSYVLCDSMWDGLSMSYNCKTLSADFSKVTYQWENMLDEYLDNIDSIGELINNDTAQANKYRSGDSTMQVRLHYDSTQAAAVAQLMYHCGIATEMNYRCSGSGTDILKMVHALTTYFDYDPTGGFIDMGYYTARNNYEDGSAILRYELKKKRPIYCIGYDSQNNYSHAFLVDGYDNKNYFHINWGWAGIADGYFLLSNFRPNGGLEGQYYDRTAFIIDLRPKEKTTPIPNTLSSNENSPSLVKLEIFDCLGNRIKTFSSPANNATDLHLPCGSYILLYRYSDATTKIKHAFLCK